MSNESGHWYTREGKAMHQVAKANGEMRDTTLADARKFDLLPSVSAFLRVRNNPGLQNYIEDSMLRAAFNCPPSGGEEYAAWKVAIKNMADAPAKTARDLGTTVHGAIEKYYSEPLLYTPYDILVDDKAVSCDEFVKPVAEVISGLGLEVMHSESIVVNNAHGYAGTADIIFKTPDSYGVLDFKTCKTEEGKRKKPYNDHGMQIAAYVAAVWGGDFDYPIGPKCRGYNLYISTNEIGRVDVHEWSAEDLQSKWLSFVNHIEMWIMEKNYDPRRK